MKVFKAILMISLMFFTLAFGCLFMSNSNPVFIMFFIAFLLSIKLFKYIATKENW